MTQDNLIEVPVGLLAVFDQCYGFVAGSQAMRLMRDLYDAGRMDAVSLPVHKSLQPDLDYALENGCLPDTPEHKIDVGMEEGEPVMYLGKAMGALGLVVQLASARKVPTYAGFDLSLPLEAGCQFTASYLYTLQEKHDSVVHICTPQQAKLIVAYL